MHAGALRGGGVAVEAVADHQGAIGRHAGLAQDGQQPGRVGLEPPDVRVGGAHHQFGAQSERLELFDRRVVGKDGDALAGGPQAGKHLLQMRIAAGFQERQRALLKPVGGQQAHRVLGGAVLLGGAGVLQAQEIGPGLLAQRLAHVAEGAQRLQRVQAARAPGIAQQLAQHGTPQPPLVVQRAVHVEDHQVDVIPVKQLRHFGSLTGQRGSGR